MFPLYHQPANYYCRPPIHAYGGLTPGKQKLVRHSDLGRTVINATALGKENYPPVNAAAKAQVVYTTRMMERSRSAEEEQKREVILLRNSRSLANAIGNAVLIDKQEIGEVLTACAKNPQQEINWKTLEALAQSGRLKDHIVQFQALEQTGTLPLFQFKPGIKELRQHQLCILRHIASTLKPECGKKSFRISVDFWISYLHFEACFGDAALAMHHCRQMMRAVASYHKVHELFACLTLHLGQSQNHVDELCQYLTDGHSVVTPSFFSCALAVAEQTDKLDTFLASFQKVDDKACLGAKSILLAKEAIAYARGNKIDKTLDKIDHILKILPRMQDKWQFLLLKYALLAQMGKDLADFDELFKQMFNIKDENLKHELLLAWSRICFIFGKKEQSKEILDRAEISYRNNKLCKSKQKPLQWRFSYLMALQEIQQDKRKEAIATCDKLLAVRPDHSRMAYLKICLQIDYKNDRALLQTLQVALTNMPKAGDIALQLAELRMNPLSEHFNLEEAEKNLINAFQHTPQFFDTLIEIQRFLYIRKKLMDAKVLPATTSLLDRPMKEFIGTKYPYPSQYGFALAECRQHCKPTALHTDFLAYAQTKIEAQWNNYSAIFLAAAAKKQVEAKDCAQAYLDLSSAFGDTIDLIKQRHDITTPSQLVNELLSNPVTVGLLSPKMHHV